MLPRYLILSDIAFCLGATVLASLIIGSNNLTIANWFMHGLFIATVIVFFIRRENKMPLWTLILPCIILDVFQGNTVGVTFVIVNIILNITWQINKLYPNFDFKDLWPSAILYIILYIIMSNIATLDTTHSKYIVLCSGVKLGVFYLVYHMGCKILNDVYIFLYKRSNRFVK